MYEIRVPMNYAFGQLTNAGAISDTTLTSTDFAGFPSNLSTTVYIPLTLQDPANKAFEIVWATAHAAGSSTLTIIRGREGTAARAWPASTLWACAPTLRDAVLPVVNSAALPADPHIGLRVLQQDTQQMLEWSAGGWALELGKGILNITKRNVADAIGAATTLMETLALSGLKASRWYKAVWTFNANASGTVNPPNGTASIHLSAVGAAVSTADAVIRTAGVINQSTTSPGLLLEMPFTVPSDGTYQLGCSAASGGSSTTLNFLASGAAGDTNAANRRAFWVEDMGLK
ncbi:hypothetical protein [Amycolatopsis sp. CA-128772]|uniref:hypothetical protein n=1 Tax=Amycolatopsis sp. CA-128772 TaxID=2073159 RepID=UPI000CD1A0B8|nr:hypothetical protein [Amycolatopsis sp. CA-128772]